MLTICGNGGVFVRAQQLPLGAKFKTLSIVEFGMYLQDTNAYSEVCSAAP